VGGGEGLQLIGSTGAGEDDVAGVGEAGGSGPADPSPGAGEQDLSHERWGCWLGGQGRGRCGHGSALRDGEEQTGDRCGLIQLQAERPLGRQARQPAAGGDRAAETLHAQFLSWRCCRVVRPRSGWSRRAGMPAWAATFTLTWSRLLVSAVRHSPAPAWSSIGLGRPYARVPAAASGSSLVPIPEPGPPSAPGAHRDPRGFVAALPGSGRAAWCASGRWPIPRLRSGRCSRAAVQRRTPSPGSGSEVAVRASRRCGRHHARRRLKQP
jgi:hypothetical protein